MTRLSDLSPEQIRLMVKLDDGFDHIDSVGIRDDQLDEDENLDLLALIMEGLAVLDNGRDGLAWARLTEEGRKVRAEGGA